MSLKAVSFSALEQKFRQAIKETLPNTEDDWLPWVAELYDEFGIVEVNNREFFRVPYTFTGDEEELTITVSGREEWQKVERQQIWVDTKAMQMNQDQLVYYGGEVKAQGSGKIGGYLVLFGDEDNADLAGDYFTKSTDFGPHQQSVVLYQHGQEKSLQDRVLDTHRS